MLHRAVSADDAVGRIASGMRVFIHGAAATPTPLVEALSRRRDLADVALYHLHTNGPAPFADAEHVGRSLRERGEALISIAHPDFRAELTRDLAATRHVTLS